MNSPILLVQWLGSNEYREAEEAIRTYYGQVELCYSDAATKYDAAASVKDWLVDNSNAQSCFIGTHGIVGGSSDEILGVGPVGDPTMFASWDELWDWFDGSRLLGGLWLGACYSKAAAVAFSSLWAHTKVLRVPHLFGFSDAIEAAEIERILLKLIEFSDINGGPDIDRQLEILRSTVPGTKIKLFYPAFDRSNRQRYIDVDFFEEEAGITFADHLESNRRRYAQRTSRG